MNPVTEFAAQYALLPRKKREAWLIEMCALPHHRLCLEFTALSLKDSLVGDSLLAAIEGTAGAKESPGVFVVMPQSPNREDREEKECGYGE